MKRSFIFVWALVTVFAWMPERAEAATITVNTTADENNADGDCSLREAIRSANGDVAIDACTAGSGADTVSVPAGTYTLSIAGAGEDVAATERATAIRPPTPAGPPVLMIPAATASWIPARPAMMETSPPATGAATSAPSRTSPRTAMAKMKVKVKVKAERAPVDAV